MIITHQNLTLISIILYMEMCAYTSQLLKQIRLIAKTLTKEFYRKVYILLLSSNFIKFIFVHRYWDYLQGINYDYAQSARTAYERNMYLNDAGMPVADTMLHTYLNITLNLLTDELIQDINSL